MNAEAPSAFRLPPSAAAPRTAVLLSGHMRTFERCFPTLRHHVLRHYPAADFFVSTVQDADTYKTDYLVAAYGERVHIDIKPAQPVIPLPAGCPEEASWQPGQCFMHEPYAISVPPQAVLRQLWQLNECWQFFTAHDDWQSYGTILRVRPDSYFHSFARPLLLAPCDLELGQSLALTPWWGRFGGLNDRFAVLQPRAAEAYFTTFAQLDALIAAGCPLHPESLIKASLERAGNLVRDTLRAEFSTLKQVAGELQVRPPEIHPIDLAHAALA